MWEYLRPFKKKTKILQSLGVQTNHSMNLAEATAQLFKTIFLLDRVSKACIMDTVVGNMLLYFPWIDSYSRHIQTKCLSIQFPVDSSSTQKVLFSFIFFFFFPFFLFFLFFFSSVIQ